LHRRLLLALSDIAPALAPIIVSRRHAEICRYGDHFTVRDVGSRNGTFLQNKRLAAESALSAYEELRIGGLRLLFVQGGDDMETLHDEPYLQVRSRLINDTATNTSPAFPRGMDSRLSGGSIELMTY
jgi:pSer/pThr/pTyr-binding forkhead associated (FHA) protein